MHVLYEKELVLRQDFAIADWKVCGVGKKSWVQTVQTAASARAQLGEAPGARP